MFWAAALCGPPAADTRARLRSILQQIIRVPRRPQPGVCARAVGLAAACARRAPGALTRSQTPPLQLGAEVTSCSRWRPCRTICLRITLLGRGAAASRQPRTTGRCGPGSHTCVHGWQAMQSQLQPPSAERLTPPKHPPCRTLSDAAAGCARDHTASRPQHPAALAVWAWASRGESTTFRSVPASAKSAILANNIACKQGSGPQRSAIPPQARHARGEHCKTAPFPGCHACPVHDIHHNHICQGTQCPPGPPGPSGKVNAVTSQQLPCRARGPVWAAAELNMVEMPPFAKTRGDF